MNFSFKNSPWIAIIYSGGHKNSISSAVLSKLAVFVPGVPIVAQFAFGMDKWSESVDSFCMRREGLTEKRAGIGPLMVGTVAPGFFQECECGLEGCAQFYGGGEICRSTLTQQLKPVIGNDAKQSATKSYERDDYRSFYGWSLTGHSIAVMY
ncbi:MAG: hypothetical protein K8H75_08565 [Sulfuricella sp.]|nr:hypothetical protein [Sulfuricella sp.]